MDNLKAKKRHPEEIAVYTAIYVCAAFSVLLLLGIINKRIDGLSTDMPWQRDYDIQIL